MIGARALLAFRGIDNPTDDQLLGAMMEADYQSFMISWGKGWEQWAEVWIKMHSKRRR
jgi:hypothetical protein